RQSERHIRLVDVRSGDDRGRQLRHRPRRSEAISVVGENILLRCMKPCFLFIACLVPLLAQPPKPKHTNRMIDVLEQGQPIYYDSSHEGAEGGFELGKKDAQTWADYIVYDMEHAPWNIRALAEYMRGMAAGGPTRTGHRMPPVIAVVPVNGLDEATVRANAWQIQQALATGVHGVLLAHADTPGAVRAFVEAARFPIHKQGVGQQ